jgi:hypothetical protein
MVVVSRGGPKVAKAETSESVEMPEGGDVAAAAHDPAGRSPETTETGTADAVPPKPAIGEGAA